LVTIRPLLGAAEWDATMAVEFFGRIAQSDQSQRLTREGAVFSAKNAGRTARQLGQSGGYPIEDEFIMSGARASRRDRRLDIARQTYLLWAKS
jgi:hypothetical protein